MIRRPTRSALFPYTTLFRYRDRLRRQEGVAAEVGEEVVVDGNGADVQYPLPHVGHLALGVGARRHDLPVRLHEGLEDRKSTRLNSSHANISYAVFCLKKYIFCAASKSKLHSADCLGKVWTPLHTRLPGR